MPDEKERLDALQCVTPPGPGRLELGFAESMSRLAHLAYCRFEEDGPGELTRKLGAGGLEILKTFNGAPTGNGPDLGLQAFLCKGACYSALVFRGTTDLSDWFSNSRAFWKKVKWNNVVYEVHSGFFDSYVQVHAQIDAEVAKLRAQAPSLPLLLVGHSLGGAQAQMATPALAHHRPHYCVTFGSPKVSNGKFAQVFAHTKHFRVENEWDIVPALPPMKSFYQHVGEPTHLKLDPPGTKAIAGARTDARNWWIEFRSMFGQASDPGWKGIQHHDIKNYRDRLHTIVGHAVAHTAVFASAA